MAFTGGAGAKTYARTNSVYSGTTTWQQTDAAERGIRSDDHDNHDQDMATAINTSLQKNGDNSLTASIPAAGFGMTGVGVLGSATEASITSASTADLLGSAALFNLITGTVTITSLGTGANRFKIARFNGALTLTYDATTLITPGAANITTAAGDTMGVTSDASSNARVVWYQRASVTPSTDGVLASSTGVSTGFLFGLTLSNSAGDPTNDIDIAAGSARDSTDVGTMALGSSITKQLDATWAVGTNAGGLDTGSIANTTYHVWLIKRVDTGVVDVLYSTSASAPTMPSNYTLKRRIGSIVRSGAAIRTFKQDGDQFRWLVGIQDVSVTNPGTSAVTRTLSVPVGTVIWASISAILSPNGATTNYGLISALDETDTNPATTPTPNFTGIGTSDYHPVPLLIKTNTSAQVRSRISPSAAGDTLQIYTWGWVDTRGRVA